MRVAWCALRTACPVLVALLLAACARAQPARQSVPSLAAGQIAGQVAVVDGKPLREADWQQARAYAQATLLLLGQPGDRFDENAVFEGFLEDRLLERAADEAGFDLAAAAVASEEQRLLQVAGVDASRLAEVLTQVGLSRGGWEMELSRSLRAASFLEDVVLADVAPRQRDDARRRYLQQLRQEANLIVMLTPPPSVGLEPGQTAPDFELLGLDGRPVRLSKLRGQPLLLNFWATWCGPCRQEMPLLQAAAERYADQGLVVVSVDVGEQPETVRNYARSLGVEFPILLDATQDVSDLFRVYGLPTSFFLDRQGVVDFHLIGPLDARTLDRQLDAILSR